MPVRVVPLAGSLCLALILLAAVACAGDTTMAYASDGLRTSLESSPVFRAAPAVRSGHYLPVSVDTISALRLPSVLSTPYGLDQLEPGLAKALG
ncbi:MAG: hypothetical protein M3143_13895 [Actinomycetota bacterium]|nr:hypothetical protein [Actinomycetota bacterium]